MPAIVGEVIEKDGKYLLVQEARNNARSGVVALLELINIYAGVLR